MDSVNNIEEYPLGGRELCEVVNIHSLYFAQEVFVSHRAYAAEALWYKVEGLVNGVALWFKDEELSFDNT